MSNLKIRLVNISPSASHPLLERMAGWGDARHADRLGAGDDCDLVVLDCAKHAPGDLLAAAGPYGIAKSRGLPLLLLNVGAETKAAVAPGGSLDAQAPALALFVEPSAGRGGPSVHEWLRAARDLPQGETKPIPVDREKMKGEPPLQIPPATPAQPAVLDAGPFEEAVLRRLRARRPSPRLASSAEGAPADLKHGSGSQSTTLSGSILGVQHFSLTLQANYDVFLDVQRGPDGKPKYRQFLIVEATHTGNPGTLLGNNTWARGFYNVAFGSTVSAPEGMTRYATLPASADTSVSQTQKVPLGHYNEYDGYRSWDYENPLGLSLPDWKVQDTSQGNQSSTLFSMKTPYDGTVFDAGTITWAMSRAGAGVEFTTDLPTLSSGGFQFRTLGVWYSSTLQSGVQMVRLLPQWTMHFLGHDGNWFAGRMAMFPWSASWQLPVDFSPVVPG